MNVNVNVNEEDDNDPRDEAEDDETRGVAMRVMVRHVGHLERSRDQWKRRALAAEKLAADQQDEIFALQQRTKGAA